MKQSVINSEKFMFIEQPLVENYLEDAFIGKNAKDW